MRKIIIVAGFLILGLSLNAQSYFDIGVFGGASAYHPDLVNPSFKAPKPAYGGVIKYNLNPRIAIRANVINGQFVFADTSIYDSYSPVGTSNNMMDISSQLEFNFVPFKGDRKTKNYSSFIALGIGYTRTSGNSAIMSEDNYSQICIPFTVGWKYNITKRFGMSFEWNVRKIFIGNNEKHWYSFAGIVLGYKFGGSDLGRIIWHI